MKKRLGELENRIKHLENNRKLYSEE